LKSGTDLWTVACDAKISVFGVEIASLMFWHDPRDMIYDMGDGTCTTSIVCADDFEIIGGITIDFLGPPFMKNVLAIFNFGINKIRLVSRAY
jgi:hypothetical protein